MNESKRLKDVWDWKEEVYEKTKDMTRDERIRFFNKGLKDFIKKNGVELIIEKKGGHMEPSVRKTG